MPQNNIYVGLMSGTSMDAVDTAIVDFSGPSPKVLAYEQFPIDSNIKIVVRRVDGSTSIEKVTELDSVLGHLFADSVIKALGMAGLSALDVNAIGSHGQTILHLPEDAHARTLQIGDPNIIAYKTGIRTVADFRRMDMASGGEGAPLAPAFHEIAFRAEGVDRVILNLGGIANITLLPGDLVEEISGFDTGPGNGLLDDWNYKHNRTPMDRNSDWAATGNVHTDLLQSFFTDPYFGLTAPKSTGRDHFNIDWVNRHI
ncbi:UNVERIFIED_CONTAM: hypothetical protein GTU68_064439, partial [Idotea baltica]|nr:hypothetical protein [Idotea baltica]